MDVLRNNPAGANQLSTYVEINPLVDISALLPETSVGFLPMDALSDAATGEYAVVTVPFKEVSKGYTRFLNGDVLWAKITPCMQNGKSCVVNGLPNGVGFGSTEFHILRPLSSEVSNKFVLEYLSSGQLRQFATYAFTGSAGQQRVPASFLESLPFPRLSLIRQNELTAAMDAARAERKAKLAEADALLSGIDGFVLDVLGINTNPPQRPTFAVRINRTGAFRADPDFHSLRFRTIRSDTENGRYPAKRIAEICEQITSGFAAGSQDQASNYETGVPHLRPLNLDIFGQLSLENPKFVPIESVSDTNWCVPGEVLFNNTNSTDLVGKSAVFDSDQSCACSNHITRLRPHPRINSEYIVSVLNALRRLGYLGLLSTNFNNQAGINSATLGQLQIPLPTSKIQQTIAAEVSRRRQEARSLRTEAEAGWQTARKWFEEQLLGATDKAIE